MGIFGSIGGIIGAVQGKDALNRGYSAADDILAAVQEDIKKLPIPDIEKMKLLLEAPQIVGQLSPEEVQTYMQERTAVQDIQIDPRLRETQLDALRGIEEAAGGGLREEDLAAMRQAKREIEADEQSRQAAILNDLAQRGRAGGGAELALRAQSAQQAASRQAESADRNLIAARQAALQAMSQQASLGGQIRQQDYGEQMDRARAIDEINRFNVANRQNIAGINVGARNEAQARNLSERQRIADTGVNIRNTQQQYNKELEQQRFNNELAKIQARQGLAVNQANLRLGKGRDDMTYNASMGQAIGGIADTGIAAAMKSKSGGGA